MDWFVQNTVTILNESNGIKKIISMINSSTRMPLRLMIELLTPFATALKNRKIAEFEEIAKEGYKVITFLLKY